MLKNRLYGARARSAWHFPGWLRAGYVSSCVGLVLAYTWGFTVDDAWILARVAAHGAQGRGFSFNPGDPQDAVTPLGYAHFLATVAASFEQRDVLSVWTVARTIGALSALGAGAVVGATCLRRDAGLLWRVPLWLMAGYPFAVWAGAGLATAPVSILVLWGGQSLLRGRNVFVGRLLLGTAVGLRPELAAFGLFLTVFQGRGSGVSQPGQRFAAAMTAAVPFFAVPLVVLAVRWWSFGDPLPLSAMAKEPDFRSGLFYGAATLLWLPLAWPVLLRRQGWRSGLAGAFGAHLVGLILVGGDWMPLWRLSAPLVPLLLWWTLSTRDEGWASWAVAPIALLVSVLALLHHGSDLRLVAPRRMTLIEEGRDALADASRVAAVDVGWVGVAFSGAIVDLAGVTDRRIASLPGGHTSKKVVPGLFSDRSVDAWVVRDLTRKYRVGGDLSELNAAYVVDARLLTRTENLHLEPCRRIPLRGTPGQYVVFAGKTAKRSCFKR